MVCAQLIRDVTCLAQVLQWANIQCPLLNMGHIYVTVKYAWDMQALVPCKLQTKCIVSAFWDKVNLFHYNQYRTASCIDKRSPLLSPPSTWGVSDPRGPAEMLTTYTLATVAPTPNLTKG